LKFFDELIGFKSSQMNRKMLRYLNQTLEWYGITLEQWVVLSTLSDEENINQKTLSLKTGKNPTSLLRILDILERKKFIERREDKNDRRASSLFITDNGNKLVQEITPYIDEHFKEITANVLDQNIEIYEHVVNEIDQNLAELLKSKP
jgi:MarR family transcriptional regulator, transcriptional regulator for hemolysin